MIYKFMSKPTRFGIHKVSTAWWSENKNKIDYLGDKRTIDYSVEKLSSHTDNSLIRSRRGWILLKNEQMKYPSNETWEIVKMLFLRTKGV